MSSAVEMERAIEQLSSADFRPLRDGMSNRDAGAWDRQCAADVSAGKLDALADEARRERSSTVATRAR